MKKHFSEFYRPSDSEFSELWQTAVFVVDASFLLALYEYSETTSKELLELLKTIAQQDRLWIPHQVALEYHTNRLQVIGDQGRQYQITSKEIDGIRETFQSRTHPFLEDQTFEELEEILNKIQKVLQKKQEFYQGLIKKDHIMDLVTDLFENRVGERPSDEALEDIYKNGKDRYSKGIPPGYKDKKKGGVRQYGDLIAWFQMIEKAESEKKPIIFVTQDQKEDWWHRHRGAMIGPRPELIRELQTKTKMSFYMYQTEQFVKFSQENLNVTVPAKTFQEISRKVEDSLTLVDSWGVELRDLTGNLIEDGLRERVRLDWIAKGVTERISLRFDLGEDVFTRRGGDGIKQSGSTKGEWIVKFWYRDIYGLDARVKVLGKSDEEISQAIMDQIGPPAQKLRTAELKGRT